MNVQFYHDRNYHLTNPRYEDFKQDIDPRGGKTIAFEVPEPWVLEALTVGDFLTKQVGKARCSTDDNYNKKTGRELATSRMKPVVLTTVALHNYGEMRFVVLQDPSGNKYHIEKAPQYTKVRFTVYE